MQPSISVVVTCHDYGHFLEACLASLDDQTRKADQIIVVDDGSSDASRGIARKRAGGLLLIEQENRGQAAAFNAGFGRAEGDIVVFLDADDTLAGDALEILCGAWHESLSAICFGLNFIDAVGRVTGSYPVEPLDGDMRPCLLGRGSFPFMPTSGNAFNRRLIAPFFPLPERRWRISADAVLLRVAALAGPIRRLPFVLGNYRNHGGNSYHRDGMPTLPFMRRATRDMADACLAVADMPADALGADADIVRLELLLAFLRLRLGLAEHGEAEPQALDSVLAALPRLLRLPVGLRARLALGISICLLPLAVRAKPMIRRWAALQGQRPRWLDATVSRMLGAGLAARRREVRRPRWISPDVLTRADDGCPDAVMFNTFDWCDLDAAAGPLLRRPAGEILLPLRYMPHGARLTLGMEAAEAWAGVPLDVVVSVEGECIGQARLLGGDMVAIMLEPRLTWSGTPVRLLLSARPAKGAALAGPAGLLRVTSLSIDETGADGNGLALDLADERSFAEIAATCVKSPPPDQRGPGWPERIETGRLDLAFVLPGVPDGMEMVLRFGEGQIPGNLVAAERSGGLCQALIRSGSEVRVPLAPRQRDDRSLLLSLELDPLDPFEPPAFRLAGIGLTAVDPLVDHGREAFPFLSPGAIRTFEAGGSGLLADGWVRDEACAMLFDTLGLLRFAVAPSTAEDAELRLVVAPAETLPPEAHMALAVTIGEEPVATALLRGEAEIAVPLRAALARGDRRIELGVHAALVVQGDAPDATRRAALSLRSLRLESPHAPTASRRLIRLRRSVTLSALIMETAQRAKELDASRVAEIEELTAACGRVVEGIRDLADKAGRATLLTEETLDHLLVIGQFMASAAEGRTPVEDELSPPIIASDPDQAARGFALAILTTPSWRALAGQSLDALPESLLAFPSELARYLCAREGPIREESDVGSYRSHVLSLLAFARRAFAAEPRGSRRYRLAEEILRRFRPTTLLFASGSLRDVARARGVAIEAYLLRRGRRTTLDRPQRRSGGRLRLGVLVRNLGAAPETWILNGTVGTLPADEFDVTLFVLQGNGHGPPFSCARVVELDGSGADRAVETIRAAQLDIFLLGAFFQGYDDAAAIVAHRLAPMQVATTAISPCTTGLRSFDVMLSSAGCEPPSAAEHYTERLVCAAQSVQRFDFGGSEPSDTGSRMLTRARWGVPSDAVVMTSGAMLDKIGPDLLQAWLNILTKAPSSVLVLYPFAANWEIDYARQRFERTLKEACARNSVDRSRVILLDELSQDGVGSTLSAADIYLDSFPYAGATTVVEALMRQLPVVTLAGDTQRGLQGAAWARAFGLGGGVVATERAYVDEAARLASSAEARTEAAAAIRLSASPDAKAFGQQFAALLADLVDLPGGERPSVPRLLFHHMPKAAGTTCRKVFAGWFTIRDDDRAPWSTEPPPPPIRLSDIGSGEMLCGHFNSEGYRLRERYPAVVADDRWRLVTFLRDPLETAISYYFFEREHRSKSDPAFSSPDLDTYLGTCPPHLAEHLQSISDDWRGALDSYWFVGTAERLEEGLRWLAAALDKEMPEEIARLNETPRAERPSPQAVDCFVSRHSREFTIYRAGVARCEAILATDPRAAAAPARLPTAFRADHREERERCPSMMEATSSSVSWDGRQAG